jgi:hypothetical protein
MSTTERRLLFQKRLFHLIGYAPHQGIDAVLYQYHRTTRVQQEFYAKGRFPPFENERIITNCDGVIKKSKHQHWEAGDLCIVKDGVWVWEYIPEYKILGRIAEFVGLEWGGSWTNTIFTDIYHFQLREAS